MGLRVYDTKRREKVDFSTIEPGKVSMYVCGVTVYDYCHLGHARCYLAFDLIHRWLESSGYDVNYIQNFTDIEDKIIKRSIEIGEDWRALVGRFIDAYFEDMDALNILRADSYPRCTDYVEEMIEIIEDLIQKKHAYIANDGVYFDVHSAPEKYGILTGQNIDAVLEGAGGRVDATGSGKRDHKDFALWKRGKEGEPSWTSPWGDGRPGWHIECTAMSLASLGDQFDIHGGGHDLRFPHHEAEIFQTECHTGKHPMVHHWLHNGFVNIDGEKMSKSLGNFWTIRDILEKVPALTLRMALINAHYRSPIDMNEQIINDATKNIGRIHDTYKLLLEKLCEDPIDLPRGDLSSVLPLAKSIGLLEKIAEDFARAMDDDFNSREAVSKLIAGSKELAKMVHQLSGDDQKAYATMGVLWMEELAGDVLGLLPTREEASLKPETDPRREAISEEVEELLRQRTIARTEKNWSEADAIREKLSQIGVTVTDTADGPVWEIA